MTRGRMILGGLVLLTSVSLCCAADSDPTALPRGTNAPICVAMIEPEVLADLPQAERKALGSWLDAAITESLAKQSGLVLVDRQALDKVLTEKAGRAGGFSKVAPEEVAAALRPFWSAGVLVCCTVRKANPQQEVTSRVTVMVEAVAAQTGQLLAELCVDGQWHQGQWHRIPTMSDNLVKFLGDIRRNLAQAAKWPAVEVVDGKLSSKLTRLQWMVDDLTDGLKAAIGGERQVRLLTPRHPASTKEERLLRIMGLTSVREGDAAAGLAAAPDARVSLELAEDIVSGQPYEKTAVTAKLIWSPGDKTPEADTFSGVVAGYETLRANVVQRLVGQLATLEGARRGELDETVCKAIAREELAAINALAVSGGFGGSHFQFDPASNALGARLARHALRASHLDPTCEEAARQVALLVNCLYYVDGQTEWSQTCYDRTILECGRYLDRFKTLDENRDAVLSTLMTAAGYGAVRAAGSRERLANLTLTPLEEVFRYSSVKARAAMEHGVFYCHKRPYTITGYLWDAARCVKNEALPNCPMDQLEAELAYWREFWKTQIAPIQRNNLQRKNLPPWEMAMVGYYVRKRDWQSLRQTYDTLAQRFPKTDSAFWATEESRIGVHLKVAGDPQWQTWQPDFSHGPTPQSRPPESEKEEPFLSRLNPPYPDAWDSRPPGLCCSQNGSYVMFPKPVLMTGYRNARNVIQTLCVTGDEVWFVAPGLTPQSQNFSHTLYAAPLSELAAHTPDVHPKPVKIGWPLQPNGDGKTLPAIVACCRVVESAEGPIVWIGTTLRGISRFQRTGGQWKGKWFNGQSGLPLDAISEIVPCNWGNKSMLLVGGVSGNGRERVYWVMDPQSGAATIVEPPGLKKTPANLASMVLTWSNGRKLPLPLYDPHVFEGFDLSKARFSTPEPPLTFLMTQDITANGNKPRFWKLNAPDAGEFEPLALERKAALPPSVLRRESLSLSSHNILKNWAVDCSFTAPAATPLGATTSGVADANMLWLLTSYSQHYGVLLVGYIPAPAGDREWDQHDQWIGPLAVNGGGVFISLMLDGKDHVWATNDRYIDRLDIKRAIEYARNEGLVYSTAKWRDAYYRRIGKQGWRVEARQAILEQHWDDAIAIAADQRRQATAGGEIMSAAQHKLWIDASLWEALAHVRCREFDEAADLYRQLFQDRTAEYMARFLAGANLVEVHWMSQRWRDAATAAKMLQEQFPNLPVMYGTEGLRQHIDEALRQANAQTAGSATAAAATRPTKIRPLPAPVFPQGPAPDSLPASDEATLASLAAQLHSNDYTTYDKAIKAFVEIGGPGVPVLIKLLKDPEPEVRARAVQTLERLGPPAAPAVDALLDLRGDQPSVRGSANRALGKIGAAAKPATAALFDMLSNKKEPAEVRGSAGRALIDIDRHNFALIPALRANLDDPQPRVRAAAIGHLGELKDKSILPYLTKALWDPDPDVRRISAIVLDKQQLGATAAHVPGLVHVLKQPDRTAKIMAAQTLGSMGPTAKDALPDLVQALQDDYTVVRSTAVRALGNIGKPSRAVMDDIKRLLKDENLGVRESAQWAIRQIDRDER